MTDSYDLEERAQELYVALMKSVRECATAFKNADLPVPTRVRRWLDEEGVTSAVKELRIVVPPPQQPRKPTQAKGDWLWLSPASATPTTLIRAALSDMPLSPRSIAMTVNQYRHVGNGVIANIGTRLEREEEVITREGGVWALKEPSSGPVIFEGNVWGPRSAFSEYDLAEHRRCCILHVLKAQPDGLQVMQILSLLEGRDWLHAPISKDLIKTDLITLANDNKAHKVVGHSGKWRAR